MSGFVERIRGGFEVDKPILPHSWRRRFERTGLLTSIRSTVVLVVAERASCRLVRSGWVHQALQASTDGRSAGIVFTVGVICCGVVVDVSSGSQSVVR